MKLRIKLYASAITVILNYASNAKKLQFHIFACTKRGEIICQTL